MNNRQAGRRNRGRNNGRPNGQNRGGGESGNRIDSRARGNAAQLLEKYRNMARDAQLAGDRVNMEYYLQFADHYFRVLADNRARQEEQNPQRFRRNDDNLFDGDDFDAGEDGSESDGGDRQSQPFNAQRADEGQRFEGRRDRNDEGRRERNDEGRRDRGERNDNRNDRGDRNDNRRNRDFNRQPRGDDNQAEVAEYQPQPAPAAQAPAPVVAEVVAVTEEAAPRRRGRPRKVQPEADVAEPAFDAAILPPAISRADNDSDAEPEVEAPRRRRGRPRASAAPEAAE